jgi:hypothetical protein
MLKRILPTVIFFAQNPGWHSMPLNASWQRAIHTVAKHGYLEIDEAGERVRLVENPEISALFAECEALFDKSDYKS